MALTRTEEKIRNNYVNTQDPMETNKDGSRSPINYKLDDILEKTLKVQAILDQE